MLQVVLILTAILTAAGPFIETNAMNQRIPPMSMACSAIGSRIKTKAMDNIIRPSALILRSIVPMIYAEAFLLALMKRAFVSCTFYPGLYAATVLKVISPLSQISGDSFVVVEDTHTVCFAILPFANVNIAVSMQKPSTARSIIFLPLPRILRTIWPSLLAITVSHIILPLANVGSASRESMDLIVLDIGTTLQELLQFLGFPIKVTHEVFLCESWGGLPTLDFISRIVAFVL
jgi:hypothetical protein